MKYLYLMLNWVFGVIFLLTGAFSLVVSPLAGLSLIAAAGLLLPPVRNFVYSKTNMQFPVAARAFSVFALFIAFGLFIGQGQDRKEQVLAANQSQGDAGKAAKLRQYKIDYFNANREQIIFRVKSAIAEKNYQDAVSQSDEYLISGDKELEQLNAQAKRGVSSSQIDKKTKDLLAELKSVPVEEYEENMSLYQQLLKMHPDSELYKRKVEFYSGKIQEDKQKKRDAEAKQISATSLRAGVLTDDQKKELMIFGMKAMGINVGMDQIKKVLSAREVYEMVAGGLNLNGHLCAELVDVRSLKAQSTYEATCVAYRGGTAEKQYIIDALKGVAFIP